MNINLKNWAAEFMRFCMVGIIGASSTYLLFFIFYHFLHINYLLSATLGFLIPTFLSFFLNKVFTFKIKENSKLKHRIIRYFLVITFSLFLGLSFLKFFVEVVQINIYLANFFVLGIQTASNFIGSRLFVFRRLD